MASPTFPSTAAPLRLPLHHWHVTHGARMIDLDGWQVPASYRGDEREPSASSLALADLSAFAKVSLRGSAVPDLAQSVFTDTPTAHPRGVTTVAGNTLACRLAADHLLLLSDTPRLEMRLGDIELHISALSDDCQAPREKLVVVNATSTYAGFALIGDAVEEILRQLTALDVSEKALPMGSCAQTNLAGVSALLVRVQELSMPSVRIYVGSDLADYLWDQIMEKGRRWRIAPLGVEQWRSLRKQ